MQERTKSKWFCWAFVPYLNFVAWLHAAVRSGRSSYCWMAVFYSIPVNLAVLLGGLDDSQLISKGTSEAYSTVIGAFGVLLWIAGLFHALLSKRAVDQEIEQNENPSLRKRAGQSSEAIQTPVPSGMPVMPKPTAAASQKTFRYISADGALIGPVSAAALQTLQQAGAVTAETKVAEMNSPRFIPLAEILSEPAVKMPEPPRVSVREKQQFRPALIIAGALVFLVLVAAFLAGGGADTQIEGNTAKIHCKINSVYTAETAGRTVAAVVWRAARANPEIKEVIVTVELTDRLTDPDGKTVPGPHIMGEIVKAGEQLDELRKIESMSSLNFRMTAAMCANQIQHMSYGHFFK